MNIKPTKPIFLNKYHKKSNYLILQNSTYKYILLFFFLLNGFLCNSQMTFNDINLNKVPQKKVQEFLIEQQNNHIHLLKEILPSIKPNSELKGYRNHVKEYFLKDSLIKVWQHYIVTNPGDSWNGKKVSFGMLFSKKDEQIVYRNEYVSHIDTGQVVFLNLKLLKGIANLAAVFEFITIDKNEWIIEFSYCNGNITEGKQRLQFIETNKGYTRILHTSFYKSNSSLRDRFLYPFFHDKISNEFHRNMKRLYYKRDIHK